MMLHSIYGSGSTLVDQLAMGYFTIEILFMTFVFEVKISSWRAGFRYCHQPPGGCLTLEAVARERG